jgi:hypothetical protein
MSLISIVRAVAVGLVVSLAAPLLPASAQMDTFVVVPDAPGGSGNFAGCYRANLRLWNTYRFQFCLNQHRSYWVNGGGVDCDGRLSWRTRGRDILVSIHRTSCGRGSAWAAAEMTCRGTWSLAGIIGQIIGVPMLQTLSCTYFPSVRGYSNWQFTARRT